MKKVLHEGVITSFVPRVPCIRCLKRSDPSRVLDNLWDNLVLDLVTIVCFRIAKGDI